MLSDEENYVTVRIPRFFDDLINKYLEAHEEEMRLLGQRTSRAGVVKKALYEFLKKEGVIQETLQPDKVHGDTKPDDFWNTIKETFMVHSIVKITKETSLPPHHLDLHQLEQRIRRFILWRAEESNRKVGKDYLDDLTEALLTYHQELVKGYSSITPLLPP